MIMLSYVEEIAKLETSLENIKKPAAVIEGTVFEYRQAICDTHGEFQQLVRSMKALGSLQTKTSCPSCLMEKLQSLKEKQAGEDVRVKQANIKRLMADLQLPDRFASATLENYHPQNDEAARCLHVCKAYASKWRERLKQGGGMVMTGKPGTGKNHLALAIAKHVITEHQSSALFTTALRVARKFKSSWGKNAEVTEQEVIEAYTSPDLLIIDEVGVQFGSESEKLILFEIINTRYEKMRPTILISNLPKDELSAFIGERVIDRMNDGGGCTLAFTWDSYRSRAA
ncbi:TPA: ATP-binding protein [Yersinia enterocolitica]|nr:ATP-binding protein [Yersinia enterocolitica]